jgi:hypothetical protein
MSFDSRVAKKRFDLSAASPRVRYLIALVVVAGVAGAGWYVGRDRPAPHWVEHYLVPGLAWVGLLLIIVAVFGRVRRGRK